MSTKYQIKEVTNKSVWESFVLSKNPKSFLQSWGWGETNVFLGDKVVRMGVYEGSKLKGIAQLVKQEAKRGWHFLIPGGPLLEWSNKDMVDLFFDYVRRFATNEKCNFVRIRPELLDNPETLKIFRSLGFIKSPMHLHAQNTWILDISRSDSEILKNMRKSTRYLVKKSLKEKLEVVKSNDVGDAIYVKKLQDAVVERNNFVGFSEKYFVAQIKSFSKDNQLKVFLIKKSGKVVVAAIIIFYGDRVYYHNSGSNLEGLKANASYRLMWEVIQEAKKKNCKYFDMWGAVPLGKSKHRFSGPSLFKEGFGGSRVDWLPAQDLPVNFKYWSTYIFEQIRKYTRGL